MDSTAAGPITPARDERGGKMLGGGLSPAVVRGASAARPSSHTHNWSGLNASAIATHGEQYDASGSSGLHAGNALATYELAYGGGGGTNNTNGAPSLAVVAHSATSNGSRSARASNVHAMLSNAERELAQLREDHAIRGAEIDALKAQLQREHEHNLRLQSRHEADLAEMRQEYERQHHQLVEQITVLKGVSESALQEKKRATDEAATRKSQLMALLEKEREEKSSIMADYRAQTEALIAEQGREITGLRGLLEAAREEEDKFAAAAKLQEERRQELEEQLLRAESSLSDERVGAQRRLRDAEQRYSTQIEQLRDKYDREEAQLRQTLLKATAAQEHAEDENRGLTEKLRQLERASEHERETLRKAYDGDLATLQNELRVAKENRERVESKLKSEIERLTRGDEVLISSLRKEIEALRQQKQSQFAEFNREKEAITTEHHSKLGSLQAQLDGLRKELAEERSGRKHAEAAQQSLQLRFDGAQASLSRLQNELESFQIEARARERSTEQAHSDAVEALHGEVHRLESENAALKQAAKRSQVELQRVSDDVVSRQALIEQLKTEHRREAEMLKAQSEAAAAHHREADRNAQRAVETLRAQKVQLEADVARLARGLEEMESRASSATKQLVEERHALEAAMADTQALKAAVGELKAAVDAEKQRRAAAEGTCAEREAELSLLRGTQEEAATNLREARRQADRLRDELQHVTDAQEAANTELRAAHRQQVAQLESQLQGALSGQAHAREAAHALEEQLRAVRDEVTKWQRECISKDEHHAGAIRALRTQEDDELTRMDTVVQGLRDDLARVQAQKTALQREVAEAQREGERRAALVQEALDAERGSKQRLYDELRNKEQLGAELQGTVRLLNGRVAAKDDDLRRLESEIEDLSGRVHEAHSVIGKKEATIGQLAAKLRVYEARGSM